LLVSIYAPDGVLSIVAAIHGGVDHRLIMGLAGLLACCGSSHVAPAGPDGIDAADLSRPGARTRRVRGRQVLRQGDAAPGYAWQAGAALKQTSMFSYTDTLILRSKSANPGQVFFSRAALPQGG
jgi:hypothetical protein